MLVMLFMASLVMPAMAEPIAQQVDLIRGILPNIKNLGVVYNPAEINCVHMIEEIKSASSLNIIEAHIASADDITPATRSLIGKVTALNLGFNIIICNKIDLFYIPG